ncbi:MAG TPA: glycosyltransferase [Roseiflexaceae bacterium]|nr:glycosyltransferase [Roseiflexaceae bacterium]
MLQADPNPGDGQRLSRGALPATSLIIPSRNRPGLLLDTVQSILKGDVIPTELIIVDQSDAPNPDLMRMSTSSACNVRYIWLETQGVSHARNRGIAAARYDILVFTDDDVLVMPGWLGRLINVLCEAGTDSVVTGQVLPATEAERPGGFAPSVKLDPVPAIYAGRVADDVLFSNSMAMSRQAIERVGWFDERLGPGTRFPAAEDNDFGFRLLEAGYQIRYVPEAALYHRAWRPASDLLPLRWSYGVGQGAYYAKHASMCDRYMIRRLASDGLRYARRAVRRARRQPWLACGDMLYVLGLLWGACAWIFMHRKPARRATRAVVADDLGTSAAEMPTAIGRGVRGEHSQTDNW